MHNNMKTFKPQIRTKNFSSAPLRGSLGEFPMRAIVRLGSRTTIADAYPRMPQGQPVIEVNTVESIENSRSKLLMKERFAEVEVPQADWYIWKDSDTFINQITQEEINISDLLNILPSGILMKRVFGFKGRGMFYIKTMEDWQAFKDHAKNTYNNLDIT